MDAIEDTVIDEAQAILDSPQELWLNSPDNYPFSQKVNKNDVGGLKSFLISTTPDDQLQEYIRQMSHYELIRSLLGNGFSFKESWQPPLQIDQDTAINLWSRRPRNEL